MKSMGIGIFGASGFVGSALQRLAREQGVRVVCFSRVERPGYRLFRGAEDFEGLDALVNLAGEPILGLWTGARKREIRRSRVEGAERIAGALRSRQTGVRVLVNASAIGYYGDTGDREADEASQAGSGFLADVCREWEAAARGAEAAGVRVVLLRIGFVIGPGGAMRLVRPIFQMGLGGRLGSGRQWMSCVDVEDVAGMTLWAIGEEGVAGPVNAVMPKPVTNAEFTHALAASVRRPAIFPAPAGVLRAALGDLSGVLLDSVRVLPSAARSGGYEWRCPSLADAFARLNAPR